MIDIETIEGIFRNLDRYVGQLKQLAALPQTEIEKNLINQGAAKYYLQIAVECCLDVAHHLIAHQNWRAPESYVDSFTVLAENGVIAPDFAATLQQMVRMRNRLVHLYWEVDAAILYEVLQHDLNDFDRFKAAVYRFISRRPAA